MEKEKKGFTKIITIILLLVIIALLVLVVFKTKELKDENKKLNEEINELQNQKIEKEEESNPVYDLSKIPTTSDACTFNVTMEQAGDFAYMSQNACENELTKFIVSNVALGGVEQDLQIVKRPSDDVKNKSVAGVYVNGNYFEVPADTMSIFPVSIHNNLLFVEANSGTSVTGYVNLLVFNKKGTNIYNLESQLQKEQIKENIANEKGTMVTVYDISRTGGGNNIKITDSDITFKSYMTLGNGCVDGYRGTTYKVTYSGETFSDIKNVGGWKGENDTCEPLN